MSKSHEITIYTLIPEPLALIDWEPKQRCTPCETEWHGSVPNEAEWMTDCERVHYEGHRHASRVAVDVEVDDPSDSVLRINVADDGEILVQIGTRLVRIKPIAELPNKADWKTSVLVPIAQ